MKCQWEGGNTCLGSAVWASKDDYCERHRKLARQLKLREESGILSPDDRWEQGVDGDPRSYQIVEMLQRLDADYGLVLDIELGGDGDNGNHLCYLFDILFELGALEVLDIDPSMLDL